MAEKIKSLPISQAQPAEHPGPELHDTGVPITEEEIQEKQGMQLLEKLQQEYLQPDQEKGESSPGEKSVQAQVNKELQEKRRDEGNAAELKENIEKHLEMTSDESSTKKIISSEKDPIKKSHLKDIQSPSGLKEDEAGKIPGRKTMESVIEEGSAWYVHHAGIVLMHTFFSPFFRNCKLLEDGDFISDPARHRAVHLLRYLATGETGLPEYELVLPKFLCGVPFEEPIVRDITLTEQEKAESLDLLRAVITHWGKLGKSTPEGLQEGFLQRDGKLEKRREGWYLIVEQKSIDILLDYLPWNLRIIKLPWMPGPLRVEWG